MPFSSASLVDFEKVNFSWEMSSGTRTNPPGKYMFRVGGGTPECAE